jgi:hypothetical protein
VALAIDASSPAAVRSNAATTTTASFTPPAACALVAFVHSDANNGSATESCTVSGGGLSWSRAIQHHGSPGANTEVWWAYSSGAPGSITVSVTDNQGSVDKSLVVVVFTGADPGVIGATASGTALFLDITTTANNSWCWYAALGTMSGTLPIDANSTTYDLVDSGGFDGGDSIVTERHTTTTATSGTLTTTGIKVSSGSALHAVGVELVAATSSTLSAPPSFVTAQPAPLRAAPPIALYPPILGPPAIASRQLVVPQSPKPPVAQVQVIRPPILGPQAIQSRQWVTPQAPKPPVAQVQVSAAQIIAPTATVFAAVGAVSPQFPPPKPAPSLVLTPPLLPAFAPVVVAVATKAPPAAPAVTSISPPLLPPFAAAVTVVLGHSPTIQWQQVVQAPPLLPPPAIQPVVSVTINKNPTPTPAPITVLPASYPTAPDALQPQTAVPSVKSQLTAAPVIVLTPPGLPTAPAPVQVVPVPFRPTPATVFTLTPASLPTAPAPVQVVIAPVVKRLTVASSLTPGLLPPAILDPRVLSVRVQPPPPPPVVTVASPAISPIVSVGRNRPITLQSGGAPLVSQTAGVITATSDDETHTSQTGPTTIVSQTRGGVP